MDAWTQIESQAYSAWKYPNLMKIPVENPPEMAISDRRWLKAILEALIGGDLSLYIELVVAAFWAKKKGTAGKKEKFSVSVPKLYHLSTSVKNHFFLFKPWNILISMRVGPYWSGWK